jgi:flagellar basal-body rod protein FlgB
MIGDELTTRTVELAFEGLARRSEAIAHNLANAEVPNFRGKQIRFEDELRTALADGRLTDYPGPLSVVSTLPAGANGNNVAMEDELVSLVETNLSQQAMVHAFNYKVAVLRTAIGSR